VRAAITAAAGDITYNVLLMAKGGQHYAKAGQRTLSEAPLPQSELAIDHEGRAIRAIIDQIYVPPGCDEHCIGTLFLREIEPAARASVSQAVAPSRYRR